MLNYIEDNRFVVCRKNNKPIGVMLSRLYPSIFDGETMVLCQDLLWAESQTRAAKLLMSDFIDFGRRHADHVITMVTENTNIKASTLEKLGFKPLEQLYRLEI